MRPRRTAFTLLEVLLSLSLSVVLLAAVYAVIGYQLRQAAAGRELIERSTLVRALFSRMSNDVSNAITLPDASLARRAADPESGGGAAVPATGSEGMTPSSGTSGSSSSSTSGSSGSGTSSTTGSTSTSGSESTSDSSGGSGLMDTPVMIPSGVIGTSTELNLFISRVPSDAYGTAPNGADAQLTSDLRRIVYWVAPEIGLCRMEARIITADDAQTTDIPAETEPFLLAPEVRSIELSYFDGTSWTDNWDSSVPGVDGVTPLGPPRAIQVRIGMQQPGQTGNGELKYYRHIIAILTGSGVPLTPEGGSGSTP